MSLSENSYSGSCSTGFPSKQNMQDNLLMAQNKLEEELQNCPLPEERQKLIHSYLQKVISSPPIICDDFPPDLDWINVDKPPVSLNSLQDHIVVLDFFTYCCINCLHILPTLKRIESLYEHTKCFEIIGVHSAKFNNEKVLERVQDAVRRHSISHKVVSDPQATLWNKMNISHWPTVLVLGPKNQLLFWLIGENNVFDYLQIYSEAALSFFFPQLTLTPSLSNLRSTSRRLFSLHYPTKLSISQDHSKLAIADCGHHRVVVVDFVNEIAQTIGGPNPGNSDGCFQSARFDSLQGVCWVGNDRLYVCDTGNSSLKLCTFDDDSVVTLCSSSDHSRFQSPWDLVCVKGVLYIACAGSHQLFAFPIDSSAKIFGQPVDKLQLQLLAGSGLEENRNNSYPLKASFAQPSGIAYCAFSNQLLIADSESSSVRLLQMTDGHVKNVAGGCFDPLNLFTFGDQDGTGLDARLQHPMGIACHSNEPIAYVADTFNHKIKQVHLNERNCVTLAGEGEAGNRFSCSLACAQFNEPNGLCYAPKENMIYVADTNNHQVKMIDLNLGTVAALKINFIKRVTTENINKVVKELPYVLAARGNTLSFRSNFIFSKDYAPSKNAPHNFRLNMPSDAYSFLEVDRCDFSITDFLAQPSIEVRVNETAPESTKFTLEGVVTVYYCSTTEDFCSFKELIFKIPVVIKPCESNADILHYDLTFELV